LIEVTKKVWETVVSDEPVDVEKKSAKEEKITQEVAKKPVKVCRQNFNLLGLYLLFPFLFLFLRLTQKQNHSINQLWQTFLKSLEYYFLETSLYFFHFKNLF
jgi:hypothetical protein